MFYRHVTLRLKGIRSMKVAEKEGERREEKEKKDHIPIILYHREFYQTTRPQT